MEPWLSQLQEGQMEGAWDLFIERYRRLIFATIRHYAEDYDDVMDIFAHVCAALRENGLARLRQYADVQTHRARFSTWLVAVVRNQTIDWFRHRQGRKRLTSEVKSLPTVQRKIFEYVFHGSRSHLEAYELLRTRDGLDLSFGDFLKQLNATYRALTDGRRGTLMRDLAGSPVPPVVEPPFPDPAIEADAAERVTRALESLPAGERLAVQLFIVEEMSAADVARVVGWPSAKTVYNRVNRPGRLRL